MFNSARNNQFQEYTKARNYFITNFTQLIELEQKLTNYLYSILSHNIAEITRDYNEASALFPFWQQYPPDERGRKPVGDQYPWIEVGEHAIGDKLPRLLEKDFEIRDPGLPSGPDKRFLIKDKEIQRITNNLTDSVWLFVDIKSVGPRDDFDHTVMSHNQITGDGVWDTIDTGIKNSILIAKGRNTQHNFHCAIPPIYVLSDGTVAPVITIALKPVYSMLSLKTPGNTGGQPLSRITLAAIPNGLLLLENPKYLATYPHLFFPGKDDKGKNPLKVRCRVDFAILKKIDAWRVQDLHIK